MRNQDFRKLSMLANGGKRKPDCHCLLAEMSCAKIFQSRNIFAHDISAKRQWQSGLPLPLGGNVVRKDNPKPVRHDLSEIIRESIDYGLAHRNEAVRHSLSYARDMDANLAGKFIGMYVNEFTRDYGEVGRDAIRRFLAEAHNKGY